jgi:hypothetical protein
VCVCGARLESCTQLEQISGMGSPKVSKAKAVFRATSPQQQATLWKGAAANVLAALSLQIAKRTSTKSFQSKPDLKRSSRLSQQKSGRSYPCFPRRTQVVRQRQAAQGSFQTRLKGKKTRPKRATNAFQKDRNLSTHIWHTQPA